ncbi:sperm-associated antigen 4 [Cochliomyia hominivorax]
MKKLDRLKEEVDDIAHLILQAPQQGKPESKFLTDLIDNSIKKRLAGIWDDLYSLKKQIKTRDCSASLMGGAKTQKPKEMAQLEERINYAAEELGARVVNVKAEAICPPNIFQTLLGSEFATNPPVHMLRSSMQPGLCFGFKGNKAEVIIRLAAQILIDEIMVQHISKKQSPTEDISSAPKDFKVFGLHSDQEFQLGSFTFLDNNQNQQFYSIRSKEKFQNLKYQFETNHGHPNYTCVYRIAVYGKL